jgi:phosphatidyl-N-methylethanolamine N-methyltransferase
MPEHIIWLFFSAAALLSLERICYVLIWRAPDAFRDWCRRSPLVGTGDPVSVLATLFSLFKGLQAAVFLGWCYVQAGGTIWPVATTGWAPLVGAALMIGGQALNLSVFSRLGKVGVFYGNKLGYEVRWCRQFPFTWLRHPQYVGAVVSIWGFFIFMRFPADDWLVLPVLETLYYMVGTHFEQDPADETEVVA